MTYFIDVDALSTDSVVTSVLVIICNRSMYCGKPLHIDDCFENLKFPHIYCFFPTSIKGFANINMNYYRKFLNTQTN